MLIAVFESRGKSLEIIWYIQQKIMNSKRIKKITGIGFIGFGTPAVLASGFSDLTLSDS